MSVDIVDVSSLTVAGTSIGLDSASPTKATAFTSGARQALIIVQGAPVYYRGDGDAATSADVLLNVGDCLPILADNANKTLDNLRFIRKTSTSATLLIVWYNRAAVLTERIIRGTQRLVTEAGDSVTDDTADAVKAILATGTNRIGQVSGTMVEVRVTKALAAAAAYAANDVLSESASAGTDWDFDAVGRANGAYGYIVGAIAISESESVTPRLSLFLFNAAPTGSAVNDNVANTAPDAADLAKVIGKIDFPALESLGTTDSIAVATPSTTGNLPLPFKCAAADDAIYGVLVTRDAFTQTATDDLTIILLVEQF